MRSRLAQNKGVGRTVVVRLTFDDRELCAILRRCPLTVRQAAHYLDRPYKKIAERLHELFLAGIVRRIRYVPSDWERGNVAFAYFVGRAPAERTLHHTLLGSDFLVRLTRELQAHPDLTAKFFFPGELSFTSGLLPDVVALIQRSDGRLGCWYVEFDCGTERVNTGRGYSLADKLRTYARAFDNGTLASDLAFAGSVSACRVALIVPKHRLGSVQDLVANDAHDFVLLTTVADLDGGVLSPIWRTSDADDVVDFFGRRKEQPGEQQGVRTTRTATRKSERSQSFPHGEPE